MKKVCFDPKCVEASNTFLAVSSSKMFLVKPGMHWLPAV
jgi:hypothetical protein